MHFKVERVYDHFRTVLEGGYGDSFTKVVKKIWHHRLTNAQLKKRKARQKMQKASRRRNR